MGRLPQDLSRLAVRREARKLTQEQLAERSAVPLRTLQRLEAGKVYNPGIRTLSALARALGYPLEAICEPEWLP